MSTEVTVALITGTIALIVSLAQIVSGRKQSREIEILKSELAKKSQSSSEFLRQYLESMVDGREREIQAFREMLRHIQKVREVVREAIADPQSASTSQYQAEIQQHRNAMLDAFAEHQTHFKQRDFELVHAIKNDATRMLSILLDKIRNGVSSDTSAPFAELSELENNVCVQQAALRRRASDAASALISSLQEGSQ